MYVSFLLLTLNLNRFVAFILFGTLYEMKIIWKFHQSVTKYESEFEIEVIWKLHQVALIWCLNLEYKILGALAELCSSDNNHESTLIMNLRFEEARF